MGKIIDETGNRHGRWLVLEYRGIGGGREARWLCRCDCGIEREVNGSSLRAGSSQSCGCLKREKSSQNQLLDLMNQTFGRWTVIEKAESNKRGAQWTCKCRCGNKRIVAGTRLRSGRSQSCGCLRQEIISLPEGEAAFNALHESYNKHAKQAGRAFALTKEQFRVLTKQNCYYCGVEPNQMQRAAGGPYIYNGVDRVDNASGYTLSNTVPCCKVCNRSKTDMSIDEFLSWVEQVHKYQKEK